MPNLVFGTFPGMSLLLSKNNAPVSFLEAWRGIVMTMFDRQITLNQRIPVIDNEIVISAALVERFRHHGSDYHYDQAYEMLSFWMGRRRWLLQRLLKIQLKEFIR